MQMAWLLHEQHGRAQWEQQLQQRRGVFAEFARGCTNWSMGTWCVASRGGEVFTCWSKMECCRDGVAARNAEEKIGYVLALHGERKKKETAGVVVPWQVRVV